MQPSDLIWMNGDFVAWEDAKVHVLTHGLHYGTGVFEGIRAHETDHGTAVFRLPEHLARLRRSAEMFYMSLPFTEQELRGAVHELISRNGLTQCYVRPLVYRGYGQMGLFPLEAPVDVMIAAWRWPPYLGPDSIRNGVRGKVSSWRRISPDALIPHAKASGQYLNNVLAKIESQKAGYEEAILLDARGNVSEGSGENIFIIRDGVIVTPGQTSGILEGINRRSVMQVARDLGHEVVERDVARAELYVADEVFVTGTATLQPVPVREVDDHPVGSGEAGPITRQLQDAYADVLTGRGAAGERYRDWLDIVPVPSRAASS